jgi:hypothetical protein
MSNRGRKSTKAEEVEEVDEVDEVESETEDNVDSDVDVSEEQPKKNTKGGAKGKTVSNRANSKNSTKGAKGKTTSTKKLVAQKGKKQIGGSKTAKKGANNTPNKKKGKERYFKLIDAKTGKSYGRYTGDTPKQAASKGFTKMLQKLKSDGKHPPKQSTIYLRESTRGSARKIYGYEAFRQKLPEPQPLVITDKETGQEKTIIYHFRNKIKKVAVPDQIGGAKTSRTNKKSSTSKKGGNASKSKKGSTGKSTTTKKGTGARGTAAKKITKAGSGSKKGSTGKSTNKKSQSAKASVSS